VPVTYKIDGDKKTVRTKCVGRVTFQVINHFRTLQQDSDCPDRLDVFLDLSEVDSLPETLQLCTVVTEMKRIMSQVRFSACAILATRDAVFGMMRVFEVMANECFASLVLSESRMRQKYGCSRNNRPPTRNWAEQGEARRQLAPTASCNFLPNTLRLQVRSS
jgi:hypothetical protein